MKPPLSVSSRRIEIPGMLVLLKLRLCFIMQIVKVGPTYSFRYIFISLTGQHLPLTEKTIDNMPGGSNKTATPMTGSAASRIQSANVRQKLHPSRLF